MSDVAKRHAPAGHHGGTPAISALDAACARYALRHYSASGDAAFGPEAAAALGVSPARVFKTLLVVTGASALAVGVVPVDGTLDLKALAAALGVKKVEMAEPAVAERRTGYVRGGISPLGQRHASPTVVDESVLTHATVFVSGGRRGLEIELSPATLLALSSGSTAPIASR